MGLIAGEITAILGADSTKFDQAMDRVNRSGAATMTSLEQRLRQTGTRLKSLGTDLSFAISAPLVIAGGLAARAAITFERAFAGVRKTVEGTADDLNAIRDELRKMATEIPTSANELARFAELGGQLGIKRENIVEFTRVIAELNETTDLLGEQGATSLARFLNVQGVDQSRVREIADVIVELGNNAAATEAEILEMASRIGGAARIAGLAAHENLALSATLTSLGVQAELGGTAIQRTIIEIVKAGKNGGESLATFARIAGVSGDEYRRVIETDFQGALILLAKGLARVEDNSGNVFEELDRLGLEGQRVVQALVKLASATDQYGELLGRANEQVKTGGALNEEFGRILETASGKLGIARNRITEIAIAIGEKLAPRIVQLAEGLATLFERFAKLPVGVQNFALAVAGLLAGLGPVLFTLGSLANIAAAVSGPILSLGSALGGGGLLTALVGTSAAIGAAALPATVVGALFAMAGVIGFSVLPRLADFFGELVGAGPVFSNFKGQVQDLVSQFFLMADTIEQAEIKALVNSKKNFNERADLLDQQRRQLAAAGKITLDQFLIKDNQGGRGGNRGGLVTEESARQLLEFEREVRNLMRELRAEQDASRRSRADDLKAGDAAELLRNEADEQRSLNRERAAALEIGRAELVDQLDAKALAEEDEADRDQELQDKLDRQLIEELFTAELAKQKDLDEELVGLRRSVATIEERRADQLRILDGLLEAGKITLAEYEQLLARVNTRFDEMAARGGTTFDEMGEAGTRLGQQLKTDLADFFFTRMEGGLKGLVESFRRTLARMAADAAASNLFKAIFSGVNSSGTGFWASLAGAFAGQGGKAAGGVVEGPGTTTSDSVLARLSRGEFVVRAAAVTKFGRGLFDRLNNLQLPQLPGFAMGGSVGAAPAALASGGTTYVIDARGADAGVEHRIFRAIAEAEDRSVRRSVSTMIDQRRRGGAIAEVFKK